MQIIKDREALHQIPELDRQLPLTLQYLRQQLELLSCSLFSPVEGSICAFFDFGADSAIAFRSDEDALPVTERTGLPFASRHPGKMHACGHDGHMAILLELARRLHAKKHMNKNVLLIFQPAEETSGGAEYICKTGIFQEYNVEAVFGLHLWPGVAAGKMFSRKKELMSRSCVVKVDILGKSAHIAKAEYGIDAMAAGVEFYTRAMEMEAALPESVFRLLKFGKLESGTVGNVISGHTHMEGSLRAFEDSVFEGLQEGLLSIGKEVERSTGCKVRIFLVDGYPAVMNPPELYDKVREIVEFEDLALPSMTAEDFSWYQKTVPGIFFFLGLGDTPPLHADNFDFDPEILVKGADFFEKLAENYR